MDKISLFHILFVGGLIFVAVALGLIHNDLGVRWYLIGQGQIMIGVGFVGAIIEWKKAKH